MKSVLSILIVFCASLFPQKSGAQELMAKIVVNTQKVGMTDKSVLSDVQKLNDSGRYTRMAVVLNGIDVYGSGKGRYGYGKGTYTYGNVYGSTESEQ